MVIMNSWLGIVDIFRTFYFNELMNINDKLEFIKSSFALT